MHNLITRLFRPHRISLAIIGIPASGKSYLISDIIESFRCMGLQYYDLQRDGIAYRGFGAYDTDVMGAEGMMGTPLYACRANNHYGARMKGADHDFELDFLNIPGEIFDQNRDNLRTFFLVRNALKTKAAHSFRLVTWKRDNDTEYIVEPITVNQYTQDNITAARTSHITEHTEARMANYMDWPQIYAEINQHGRQLQPVKHKTISGTQLLDHITEYNVDSAMRAIAEVLPTILPEVDKTDFMTRHANAFYFLNYCARATDIIICDKMILPTGDNPRRPQLDFPSFLKTLENFYTDKALEHNKRPNVYMAYRGTDFLIKTKETAWRKFANSPQIAALHPDERRNIIYALINTLIYHHYNNLYTPTTTELNQHIGLPEDYDWRLDDEEDNNTNHNIADTLTERFMDFNPQGGTIMTQGSLLDLFRSHQGSTLDHLMTRAYGPHEHDGSPLERLKPHIYYTATPVSDDILVFDNDPQSHNTRFVRQDIIGDTKYFDNYGSHLCLGTFQLCMDLLQQHELTDNTELGDIYYYLQQR